MRNDLQAAASDLECGSQTSLYAMIVVWLVP